MNVKAISGWVLMALPLAKSVLTAMGKPELAEALDQTVLTGGDFANAVSALLILAGGMFLRSAPTKKETK